MAEQPEPAPWTRRGFLKSAAVAGGLAAGVSRSGPAWAQGLKSIWASHSVSTFVYGQHLVAAQKKLFEEEGVKTPDFIGGESGGGLGYLIIQSLGTLNAADMMVALFVLGVIGIVMALGIKQVEARLLRSRPEYQKR